MPLDAELAGSADERIDPALRETNRTDAFQRQVVAHHLGDLRHDPELRFSFDEQPHPREHRHAAMHAEVIADRRRCSRGSARGRRPAARTLPLVADKATDVCERRGETIARLGRDDLLPTDARQQTLGRGQRHRVQVRFGILDHPQRFDAGRQAFRDVAEHCAARSSSVPSRSAKVG